jgi:hypothetical protein
MSASVETPAGVRRTGPVESDNCLIDLGQFASFAHALLAIAEPPRSDTRRAQFRSSNSSTEYPYLLHLNFRFRSVAAIQPYSQAVMAACSHPPDHAAAG